MTFVLAAMPLIYWRDVVRALVTLTLLGDKLEVYQEILEMRSSKK
jgi:hypothetical protein